MEHLFGASHYIEQYIPLIQFTVKAHIFSSNKMYPEILLTIHSDMYSGIWQLV